MSDENHESSVDDRLAGVSGNKGEYEALVHLETGRAGGGEAEAVGDAEYPRLDPV